ncbi:MAG: competence/damage-inducible protein A [Byssovorax sp.]
MSLRCEILSTGDEVLTGMLVDTNAAYLADQMGSLGFEVVRQITVGDDRAQLDAAFRAMGESADVVLCTGGLGPTVDDLTTEVAASVLGAGLKLDAPSLAYMEGLWKSRGRAMPENNKKQALIPEPADVLPNPIGTAPGFTVKIGRAQFFFMPGVPREMKRMFTEQVVPRVEALRPEPTVFTVRIYRSFGLTESGADQRLKGLEERHPGVKLGFRAHFPEIQIKLTVKGPDAAAAQARLDAAAAEVTSIIGPNIFSDGDPIEAVIGAALRRASATVSTVESCTGGLVAERITSIAGASDYFDRGFVTYTNQAKHELAGVPLDLLEEHGAVSEACAKAMAEGARDRARTTYAISVTGLAGPGGGTPDKPVGLVYVGLAGPNGTQVRKIYWPGQREQIRSISAMVGLDMLRRALANIPPDEQDLLQRRIPQT